MNIRDVLTLPCVSINCQGTSKKRVLEIASELIDQHNATIKASDLFPALLMREKLGSTGVGDGIALPHCQLISCVSPVAAFIRLDTPVDFDTLDQKPVDLLFVLVVPKKDEEEHLGLLRNMALYLKDPRVQEELRHCKDSQSLYHILTTESVMIDND